MIQEDDVLPWPRATEPPFLGALLMRRTTQQTLLAINFSMSQELKQNVVSQQKPTKLYFSSQVRKQFKLLAVPFKPLRCCLRNDKLVKTSAKIYF